MKKIVLCLLMLCTLIFLVSCGSGKSDSLEDEAMTESEQLVYEALVEGSKDFNDPTSIKIMKCSDTFLANEYDKYIDTLNRYYLPAYDGTIKVVMIQISAGTPAGGSSTEVYCLPIEGSYKGDMKTFKNMLDVYAPTGDSLVDYATDYAKEKEAEKGYSKGATSLATSGSYPISEGTEIDITKLNKALKAHWVEMGLA